MYNTDAVAIVCAGTIILKIFEKCFQSKTMRLKQGVSRGILSYTFTNHKRPNAINHWLVAVRSHLFPISLK